MSDPFYLLAHVFSIYSGDFNSDANKFYARENGENLCLKLKSASIKSNADSARLYSL